MRRACTATWRSTTACLADFFAEGLQDGLRLAYVSSDGAEAARADLADLSDLERLLARGALHVLSARNVYGAGGPVDPERVVAVVAAATEQALADGFRGLAVSADATELVGTPAHQDAFARCEFLVDRYMASHPLSALCGYGLELGNDTVTEFAMLHATGRSNEAPLQVFGCADGAIGLAGECDPVDVATLGRVLPRLRTAGGRTLVVDMAGVEYVDHRLLLTLDRLRPWKRDRGVAAVSPAVRGPADGVVAGVVAAVGNVGSAGMRTGAAHGRVGHVHEAGFYSSDAEFLALIVPFVTGGIAAGEPVVIGYDDRKCNLLRAELARPDTVSFIADTRLYATPAGAIEAYRQQFERHVAAGAEQIRIAGDVPHEGNGGRFAGWDRYESAVNVVWQDYPVYSRCLYDATTVADRVRDVVQRTHRRLLTADGGATASPRYQEVADFERLPPSTDPLEATRPTVALVDASPRKTRHWVAEAARGRIDAAAVRGVAVRGLRSRPQRAPARAAAHHRDGLDGHRPDRGPRARQRPRTGRPSHRPHPRPRRFRWPRSRAVAHPPVHQHRHRPPRRHRRLHRSAARRATDPARGRGVGAGNDFVKQLPR